MATQINSLNYNEYGTEDTLLPNNKYRVFLELDDLKVGFSFSSKYTPLYSDVETIDSDIGPFIEGFSDDEINRQIHTVSIEAQNMAFNENEFASDEAFDYENPPYNVTQYVRYKTEYNLAKKQYMKMARASGSKKSLGDLNIDKGYSLGDLKDLLEMLKDDLAPWVDQLTGRTGRGQAGMVYFTKSGNTESPLTNERTGF